MRNLKVSVDFTYRWMDKMWEDTEENVIWNADGSKSSGNQTIGSVAWAAATNCKSCHDANDTFGNTAFPHSWGGTKMWLMSASDAGAAKTALPYGTAAGAAYNAQSPQLSDGVCLKCHVASGGTAGVGITF